MSGAYTSDGRRRSSMTHATRGHTCGLCGRTVFGNGGQVSHGRSHVRRGEAVELAKYHGPPAGTSRVFLAPGSATVDVFLERGFEEASG